MAHLRRRSFRTLFAGGVAVLLAHLPAPTDASAVGRATKAPTPSRAASGSLPPRLLPDLVSLRARDLHVTRTSEGRKLRFESALGSVGDGPVEVRPDMREECPNGKQHASQIMYRDVDENGRYSLNVDTQVARPLRRVHGVPPVSQPPALRGGLALHPLQVEAARAGDRRGTEVSFCLRDSKRVPKTFSTFTYAEHFGACSRTAPQGISIGWADVYQSYLAGQALRLPPGMGDGLYCLRVTVDPKDQLLETRDRNNSSVRAFTLRGDKITYRAPARCRPAG